MPTNHADIPSLPVYLDYQATTPMDPRVLDVMMPFLTQKFGNPHSSTHAFGWAAEAALDKARLQLISLLAPAATPKPTVIFTAGATEANNLAIKGAVMGLGARRPKVVTVVTEHKCVLASARACHDAGFDLDILPVRPDGLLDLDRLDRAVDDQTAVVSVMAVQNEIGVIQPLREIGQICERAGALFHCDAAQAVGKIPIDMTAMGIDLVSVSGHKIYGPKGVGALLARPGVAQDLVPQMSGGGQEGGLRSGTQAPALVAGLGAAAALCASEMEADAAKAARHAGYFLNALKQALPGVTLNGHPERRWPGNLNLSFGGIDGDRLLASLRDVALSSGAACASAVEGPSYVLEALGLPDAAVKSSLRVGFGRMTTDQEVDYAADRLIAAVKKEGQNAL